MRVISGSARRIRLNSLPGDNTRPTLDKIKESLFNIIMPYVEDSIVLDLFAGTGALGIEALSRGATYCDFVDISKDAYKVIKSNLEVTKLLDKAMVFRTSYDIFLKKTEKKYDYTLLILIQLCLWNFSVDFSQTVLWLSGACNYLWGMVIILAFITTYTFLVKREDIGGKKIAAVFILLPAFLAGWGNENTSGGAILIILGLTVWYYVQKKKIEWFMISGIISTGVGFLFLLLAPGNKVRGAIVKAEETYTGVEAYISRGLKVLKSIDEHLLLYLIVICILGTYFYYKKYSWKQFLEVFIFALAGLATAAVLIFTPEPMPRAYYGANIYMLIAALKMVQMNLFTKQKGTNDVYGIDAKKRKRILTVISSLFCLCAIIYKVPSLKQTGRDFVHCCERMLRCGRNNFISRH